MELLNVEMDDASQVQSIKDENKTLTHEIFELHDRVKELQDKFDEIREDSIWAKGFSEANFLDSWLTVTH